MFNFVSSRIKEKSDPTRSEYGFTLIELLVVILIIGVLASIAIPAFLNQRQRAVDAQTQSDMHNLQLAVNTWMVDNPNATQFNGGQVGALITSSGGTRLTLIGTPDNYCLKAYNSQGKAFNSTGSPYLIYRSDTGQIGSTSVLGHASSSSCGTSSSGWFELR